MRIAVTGGDGFIAKNLRVRLAELKHDVLPVTRATTAEELRQVVSSADFVFHLAGANRPENVADFEGINVGFTKALCSAVRETGRNLPIAFASSVQATLQNPYGRSKQLAESVLQSYREATGASVFILRLPNVFGKWCRPNYNSVVATFCHNVSRGIPIAINDRSAPLKLLYVDDAVTTMTRLLSAAPSPDSFVDAGPPFVTTVGDVADIIQSFPGSRSSLQLPPSGTGLVRALYATYLSHLPPSDFAYALLAHEDPRGVFVEMAKTPSHGQFSYFTTAPGVTRGEHYHHTKSEKFLVVSGKAKFAFRHLITNELIELVIDSRAAKVVETVPGWAHNITNVGEGDMVTMLWASEVFDPDLPDTIHRKVGA